METQAQIRQRLRGESCGECKTCCDELKARVAELEAEIASRKPRPWDTHPSDGTPFLAVYETPEPDRAVCYPGARYVKTLDGYALIHLGKGECAGWLPLPAERKEGGA